MVHITVECDCITTCKECKCKNKEKEEEHRKNN